MTNKLVDGGDLESFVERAVEAAKKADPETEALLDKIVAVCRESLTPEKREEFDKSLAEILNEYRKKGTEQNDVR